MACFRMGGPMLRPVFEWQDQCYGLFSNGGTNVKACFRMAGPMLWPVFEWGTNVEAGGTGNGGASCASAAAGVAGKQAFIWVTM